MVSVDFLRISTTSNVAVQAQLLRLVIIYITHCALYGVTDLEVMARPPTHQTTHLKIRNPLFGKIGGGRLDGHTFRDSLLFNGQG
jgi:hypothetical protein